ncbi:MAG: acylphosphatase [Alphaproteobacteria bacterium]|jgi:acylphosphatase|nr:acylphosphatase [Alphaproteobacteria bacterium]
MAGTISVRVRILGHVQGVWFRAWTVNIARDLCLDGWVRNRDDGSVEAAFAGPAPQVEKMITNCGLGPPGARVRSITREPADPSEFEGRGFRELSTS